MFCGVQDQLSRADFLRLISNSMRFDGMTIRKPMEGATRARACSVQAGTVLTASLLARSKLNTAEHRRQVQGAAEASREARERTALQPAAWVYIGQDGAAVSRLGRVWD